MATPSIGGETVFSILDRLSFVFPHLIDITRAGINGREYHNTGSRGDPEPVRVQAKASSAAAIGTVFETFRAMINTSVTVVDDDGLSAILMFIHNVKQTGKIRTHSPSDGTTYAMLELTFTFEDRNV